MSVLRIRDGAGYARYLAAVGAGTTADPFKLRMSNYLFDIAEGNVPGHSSFVRYGHNDNVGTSWESLHHPSTLRTYLTAAERLQITSTDADDDGAPVGNGARTVKVVGLDDNFDALEETVTMNGVANVLTDAAFRRISELEVMTAGATGYNEGTITASNNADSVVLDQMEVMENTSHSASYTVPDGYTAYVLMAVVSEASNKGSEFGLWVRLPGDLWKLQRNLSLIQTSLAIPVPLPFSLPGRADIELRAKGVLAGAYAAGGFEGWIET